MVFSPGSHIGKYVLRRLLGQGGFGLVFAAYDESLDRDVALKFLKAEYTHDPGVVKRFLQEARSAAKVLHPGITTVYEVAQVAGTNTAADGTAFIAMELLDGETLTERMGRVGKQAPAFVTELGRQLASALECAHKSKIVHRDLKPDNILLIADAEVPGGIRAKVLDFGIAKLLQPAAAASAATAMSTESMLVFGTPRYMSPEQCKSSANVDHRSDIYTLGTILFEMLAGRAPFQGQPGELIAQHLLVAPPSLRELASDAPADLLAIIERMMAKEPDARPASMAAVQRALDGTSSSPRIATAPVVAADEPSPGGTAPGLGAAGRTSAQAIVAEVTPKPSRELSTPTQFGVGIAALPPASRMTPVAVPVVIAPETSGGTSGPVASAETTPAPSAQARASWTPVPVALAEAKPEPEPEPEPEPPPAPAPESAASPAPSAAAAEPHHEEPDDGAIPRRTTDTPTTLSSLAGSSVQVPQQRSRGRILLGAVSGVALIGAIVLFAMRGRAEDPSVTPAAVAATPTEVAPTQLQVEPILPPEPPPTAPAPAAIDPAPAPPDAALATVPSDHGSVVINAKPACDILVDGKPIGSSTPHELELPVGKHKITLVNAEAKLRDSFHVTIEAGEVEVVAKDYSDKLKRAAANPGGRRPTQTPTGDSRDATINPFARPK